MLMNHFEVIHMFHHNITSQDQTTFLDVYGRNININEDFYLLIRHRKSSVTTNPITSCLIVVVLFVIYIYLNFRFCIYWLFVLVNTPWCITKVVHLALWVPKNTNWQLFTAFRIQKTFLAFWQYFGNFY